MTKKKTKHKPKKSRRRPVFWPLAALLLLIAAAAAGIWWDRHAMIGDVRFSGHDFTLKEELESAFEPPIGVHPDSVDFRKIESAVEELPYIESSSIRMGAGGRMVVDLREREPISMLVDGSRSVYIDREGVKLPRRSHRPMDLPLLHGFSIEPSSEPLSGDAFDEIRDFLSSLTDHDLAWATISEVGWNRDEGVIALTQEEGVKLIFGRDRFPEKLRYWDAFYKEVVAKENRDEFGIVDLRFRNQIVTR